MRFIHNILNSRKIFTLKKILSVFLISLFWVLQGCGNAVNLANPYDVFNTSAAYGMGKAHSLSSLSGYSDNIAVIESDIDNDAVYSDLAEAALIVNTSTNTALYSQNAFEQLYPASTTKIMTAYLVLNNCEDLSQITTVSSTALDLEQGSSVCGLSLGDKISIQDLLYGMMLESGNDAANVLAEYVSGSISDFAALMSETALKLGATGTHFTNANGLTDEDHYTTCYDLYLIFNAAINTEGFDDIISTSSYNASYSDINGSAITAEWTSTDRYITGSAASPEGVYVLGGKTGTTSAAGSCLVLLSKNDSGERFISVVLKSNTHDDLYSMMNQLLSLEYVFIPPVSFL